MYLKKYNYNKLLLHIVILEHFRTNATPNKKKFINKKIIYKFTRFYYLIFIGFYCFYLF